VSEEPVRLGRRKCRWCGRTYKAPIGSGTAGCPDCAPRLSLTIEVGREAGVRTPKPKAEK